jgi:Holliday junction resolvase - archaeal type
MTAIIGIFGKLGVGKTMLLTFYAKKEYEAGRKIYCNYALKDIPFTYVDSITDFETMRNGCAIMDEFWLWANSRLGQSLTNRSLIDVCMRLRKRDVDLYYTSQRAMAVDVMVRSVTNFYLYPFKYLSKKDKKWHIAFHGFDEMGKYLKTSYLGLSVEEMGKFYNTNEEVNRIDKKTDPLAKGIQLEEKFASALKKMDFDAVDLLPNSGSNSSWLFDVLAWKNGQCYCFDVKGVSRGRITLKTHGNALRKQIKNAYIHKAKPYLAFPDPVKKYLTNPGAWFVFPLSYHCDLLNYSSDPTFNVLIDKSYALNSIFRQNVHLLPLNIDKMTI